MLYLYNLELQSSSFSMVENFIVESTYKRMGCFVMMIIGFSTGALAHGDYHQALEMLADKDVNAVELSALRQEEPQPLVEDLDNLDLGKFRYVAFHAPSSLDRSFELPAIKLFASWIPSKFVMRGSRFSCSWS